MAKADKGGKGAAKADKGGTLGTAGAAPKKRRANRDEVTVAWGTGQRTFSRELHGDDFEALAAEFAEKHGAHEVDADGKRAAGASAEEEAEDADDDGEVAIDEKPEGDE